MGSAIWLAARSRKSKRAAAAAEGADVRTGQAGDPDAPPPLRDCVTSTRALVALGILAATGIGALLYGRQMGHAAGFQAGVIDSRSRDEGRPQRLVAAQGLWDPDTRQFFPLNEDG